MAVDGSLVGRAFPPTRPYRVTDEKVRELAAATGMSWESGDRVPATFPIVLAFDAMNAFLEDVEVELSRIVHGEQKFSYVRPIAPGDVLTATLSVASLRQIGGNDIIGTVSEITDESGALVCTTSATLVHRAAEVA
ncbi:MaoC family dehydratase N-terminal domain-containing protein [Nocardioides sp.]|uniref:FAS1-like dehydratase domain-containing protein n=1 Tax=Nocardioides sp. TaxID=35761 RepID=UPI0019B809BC|nr:MaoC family dehydratase N-terminal domain-containing protein [Nocardioides sp.]MBC7276887.1 MaoC family dehydratase N-terminal domain-containing protein [Nocardioides sp.]